MNNVDAALLAMWEENAKRRDSKRAALLSLREKYLRHEITGAEFIERMSTIGGGL